MGMSNAKDPFEMEDGFEDIPVVQKPVQTVNKVANTAVKQTAQQVKATTKAFISQLYGSSSPTATDDDQQQTDTTVDPMSQAQKVPAGQAHTPVPQQAAHANTSQGSQGNQTKAAQSDEEKMQLARRELQKTHRSDYYIPTFGDITNLESDIQKEAQKRQQEEQQKEQEEEKEKQQLEELEEKKKKEPIAVTRAKNKAESNRGAAG
jgi:hypothetical protein